MPVLLTSLRSHGDYNVFMKKSEPQWLNTSHFNFDYFSFSSACVCYQTVMKKLLGFPFNYKYENLDIYYDQHDFAAHERLLETSGQLIKEHIDYIENQSHRLIEASKKYGSKKDLESFAAWYEAYLNFLPTLGIVVAPERILTKKIKAFLPVDSFEKVSFSNETATAEELTSLLTIAAASAPEDETNEKIRRHLEAYAWLGNKWMTYNPFTVESIQERIESYKGKTAQQLTDIAANRQKMNNDLEGVLARVSPEQRFLIEQYRRLLYWRTGRGEAAALSCSLTLPLFTWVGLQVGLNRAQVVRYSYIELQNLIKSDKKVENPEGRQLFNAVLVGDNLKVEWYSSDSKSPATASRTQVDSFTGTVASNGCVRGVVRIVHDIPDIHAFKKGEILVAVSTNPNMVTAMEKAAAFITDVGGLTSHAAIISRELNVPCIIDTKIATKVLQDGDMVEVDARKGVVKILKDSYPNRRV